MRLRTSLLLTATISVLLPSCVFGDKSDQSSTSDSQSLRESLASVDARVIQHLEHTAATLEKSSTRSQTAPPMQLEEPSEPSFHREVVLPNQLRVTTEVHPVSAGLLRVERVYAPTNQGGKLLGTRTFSADRLLVQLRSGTSFPEAEARLATLGYVAKSITDYGLVQLSVPVNGPDSIVLARDALEKEYSFVSRADFNELVPVATIPNDAYFCSQWQHHNGRAYSPELRQGTDGSWTCGMGGPSDGLSELHSVEAWDVRHDASDVVVAFIDTGFHYAHPDLAANAWTNPNEIAGNGLDDDGNGYVDDVHGIDAVAMSGDPEENGSNHGTMVAGTIGAVGNNGIGISGVAWNVQLMGLRAEPVGQWGNLDISAIVRSFDYAIANGAQVINCSFGTTSELPSIADAIERARAAGIVVVAAAGNDGIDTDVVPFYPAAYAATHDNMIVVGAVDDQMSALWLHNWGVHSVHLAAPTDYLISTVRYSENLPTFPAGYGPFSGTSSAAPLVTGAVALLAAERPSEGYGTLIQRILQGVDPITGFDTKCSTGGRLNVYRSLTLPVGSSSEPCSPAIPKTGGQSGNFETTGAVCYKITDNIAGWGCSNFDGRTLEVNGVAVTCQTMPLPPKVNGAYYFKASAGTYPWASMYWWQ